VTNKRKSTVRGRRARRTNPLLPLAAVAALAIGAFLILGRGGEIEGIQKFGDLSRDHTAQAVAYTMAPPLGGAHSEAAQNCGIYRLPVRNEPAVHSLEHGAVWITYQPGLSEADLERLKGLARGHTHVLLSPYPGISTPVVAVAWGLRLELPSADDSRLAQFVRKYENGPQNPEPGAACSGVGTPDEV
jgi:hypothetical protein